jgi:hypothetical protein
MVFWLNQTNLHSKTNVSDIPVPSPVGMSLTKLSLGGTSEILIKTHPYSRKLESHTEMSPY